MTCWHLFFAAVVTQVLARTTKLLDSRHALPISGRFYVRTILPIGLMASGSLVCSNFVYLYLSVAFIQMLKASAPVIVLFTSWLWGLVDPSLGTIVNILFIVSGVALASAGEISLSWIGVAFQLVGLVFEAVRVVMIQVVLSAEGYNMDPLVGLYYYAPVCAAFNFLVACVVELPHFAWEDLQKVGWLMLLLNAGVAFLLNFASMVLVSYGYLLALFDKKKTDMLHRLAKLQVSSQPSQASSKTSFSLHFLSSSGIRKSRQSRSSVMASASSV